MPNRTFPPLQLFRRLLATVAIAALLVPPAAQAANPPAALPGPENPQEVEAFIDGFFNREDVKAWLTGAVVTVVKDDKVLLNKGYGYADLEQKTPADPERTLFRLASISKTFTATAVMQLAEQNKLDLNQDVGGYLGGLKIPNKTGSPLTVKHLMTHTSGFDRTEADEDEGEPQDVYTLNDFVKDNLPTVVRKPGEAFRYDNYAYDLLGYIVQYVSGEPFEAYVAKHIFAPLGMANSYFTLAPDVQKRLATPYDGAGEPLPQYATFPNNSPDGGLISNGADMARFMIAELNSGKLGEQTILTKQSLDEMQRFSVTIHPDLPGVGYGFESSFPQLGNGQYVIDKSGVSSGFQSHLWLLPERKTGLFIALNSTRDARKLRTLLFQTFMDHYFPKMKAEDTPSYMHQTKAQLARLSGIYRDLRLPMWHYDVVAQDGGLVVTDSYGVHNLKQLKALLFEDENGRKAAFKADGSGNIVYFFYNNADAWAEKLPERKLFADVPDDHPYASFIYYVQQTGALAKEDSRTFRPEQPMTRAQFVGQLIRLAGGPLSTNPPSFADTANSPYAAEIETALEAGVIKGSKGDRFNPDRPITRQEAAVILARAFLLEFGAAGATPLEAKLKGEVDEWALKGVKTVVARGYYGPEVVPDADGAIDFHAKLPLQRQEAAAMFYHFP